MNKRRKASLQLHTAVLLFGFTAILGNLINMTALMIVWWRVILTCFSIVFITNIVNKLKGIAFKNKMILMGIGGIIGLHWLTFYRSVKLSNASVTLICMATTSFFTALLEPIFTNKKIHYLQLIIGMVLIPCMVLVVNGIRSDFRIGALVGLTSACLAALFSIFNKKYVNDMDLWSMTFIEMIGVLVLLSIFLPFALHGDGSFSFLPPSLLDWLYLATLAFLCTTMAWVLSLYALRVLSVFETNLVINLEPVYGIVLAAILLHEHKQMQPSFYIGSLFILAIVISYPFLSKKIER